MFRLNIYSSNEKKHTQKYLEDIALEGIYIELYVEPGPSIIDTLFYKQHNYLYRCTPRLSDNTKDRIHQILESQVRRQCKTVAEEPMLALESLYKLDEVILRGDTIIFEKRSMHDIYYRETELSKIGFNTLLYGTCTLVFHDIRIESTTRHNAIICGTQKYGCKSVSVECKDKNLSYWDPFS